MILSRKLCMRPVFSHVGQSTCIKRTIRAESQMVVLVGPERLDVATAELTDDFRGRMVGRPDVAAHRDACRSIHGRTILAGSNRFVRIGRIAKSAPESLHPPAPFSIIK